MLVSVLTGAEMIDRYHSDPMLEAIVTGVSLNLELGCWAGYGSSAHFLAGLYQLATSAPVIQLFQSKFENPERWGKFMMPGI